MDSKEAETVSLYLTVICEIHRDIHVKVNSNSVLIYPEFSPPAGTLSKIKDRFTVRRTNSGLLVIFDQKKHNASNF